MPKIDLTDDEHAAVTAAIRGVIEGDRYPQAPRLEPLRAALGKLEAASKSKFREETLKSGAAPPDGSPQEPSPAKATTGPRAPRLPPPSARA